VVLRKSTVEQAGLGSSAAEANLDDFRIRMLTEQVEAQNSHIAVSHSAVAACCAGQALHHRIADASHEVLYPVALAALTSKHS
jgi:hypothetical protein